MLVLSPYGKDSNFFSVGGGKFCDWKGLDGRKTFKFGVASHQKIYEHAAIEQQRHESQNVDGRNNSYEFYRLSVSQQISHS